MIYGLLHDLVGGAVARDLCFTGRRIDATDALRMGVVSEVVADSELTAAARRVAEAVAAAPRWSLARTKAKAIAVAGIPPGLPTLDF